MTVFAGNKVASEFQMREGIARRGESWQICCDQTKADE
jgi:hypothetical protein